MSANESVAVANGGDANSCAKKRKVAEQAPLAANPRYDMPWHEEWAFVPEAVRNECCAQTNAQITDAIGKVDGKQHTLNMLPVVVKNASWSLDKYVTEVMQNMIDGAARTVNRIRRASPWNFSSSAWFRHSANKHVLCYGKKRKELGSITFQPLQGCVVFENLFTVVSGPKIFVVGATDKSASASGDIGGFGEGINMAIAGFLYEGIAFKIESGFYVYTFGVNEYGVMYYEIKHRASWLCGVRQTITYDTTKYKRHELFTVSMLLPLRTGVELVLSNPNVCIHKCTGKSGVYLRGMRLTLREEDEWGIEGLCLDLKMSSKELGRDRNCIGKSRVAKLLTGALLHRPHGKRFAYEYFSQCKLSKTKAAQSLWHECVLVDAFTVALCEQFLAEHGHTAYPAVARERAKLEQHCDDFPDGIVKFVLVSPLLKLALNKIQSYSSFDEFLNRRLGVLPAVETLAPESEWARRFMRILTLFVRRTGASVCTEFKFCDFVKRRVCYDKRRGFAVCLPPVQHKTSVAVHSIGYAVLSLIREHTELDPFLFNMDNFVRLLEDVCTNSYRTMLDYLGKARAVPVPAPPPPPPPLVPDSVQAPPLREESPPAPPAAAPAPVGDGVDVNVGYGVGDDAGGGAGDDASVVVVVAAAAAAAAAAAVPDKSAAPEPFVEQELRPANLTVRSADTHSNAIEPPAVDDADQAGSTPDALCTGHSVTGRLKKKGVDELHNAVFYCDDDNFAFNDALCRELAAGIRALWRARFAISDATAFAVYMGDRSLSAFNRNNAIYFNAVVAYDKKWGEGDVFALTCHELAHAYRAPHDKHFADTMTQLVARHYTLQ